MLVQRRVGGQEVDKGTYWRFSKGERLQLDSSGILPGDSSIAYYKIWTPLLVVAAPFIGLAYIIVLPVFAFVMLCSVLAKALVSPRVAKTASFNWSPATSHLSGSNPKDPEAGKDETAESEPSDKSEE